MTKLLVILLISLLHVQSALSFGGRDGTSLVVTGANRALLPRNVATATKSIKNSALRTSSRPDLLFVTSSTLRHSFGGFGLPTRARLSRVATTIEPLAEWAKASDKSFAVQFRQLLRDGVFAYCCYKWFQNLRWTFGF